MEKVMENRSTRGGRTTCSHRLDLVALALLGLAAAPAAANINLEMRPALQTVYWGPAAEVEIGLYAVSDDDTDQTLSAIDAIIEWQPEFLRLLGNHTKGAVNLTSSSFPFPDPYGINEADPPADGDGIYTAWAPFGNPAVATPEGSLITTFVFEPLVTTPATGVDFLASAGNPVGYTIVFHGTKPNTDVTGTLSGCVVEIRPCCPADFNYDCDVDVLDFLILLAAWGTDPGGPPDINGNGDVDVNDFLLLLAAWGPCP
jgi:hypothetical protein